MVGLWELWKRLEGGAGRRGRELDVGGIRGSPFLGKSFVSGIGDSNWFTGSVSFCMSGDELT